MSRAQKLNIKGTQHLMGTGECGVCPTYFQKICAFSFGTNTTFIFDNHCIMDLYNCIEGTDFIPLKFEHCVFFANFGYVHGYKYEDFDYGEDHIVVKNTNKNPDLFDRQ
ncbi:hypothetical protein ABMA27_011947 [Loxostege sticticalis]|uniref:Kazal-like domain-containing protein n=1 Tax=Loxostege sticticalis TaxID=481309 RepID=A0ABR3II85_LOXSC